MSSHRLRVETGRWERPKLPREQRFCYICESKIEDEFHVILECPIYNDLRRKLIRKYYWERPFMMKLVQLLNFKNRKTINGLAKFAYLAATKRHERLVGDSSDRVA